MTAILDITGREILDSRGNPTVEVDVRLEDGSLGRAAVPSGASTGAHEAVELRDGAKRYGGKGVEKAVAAVNGEIFDTLCGMEAEDQIRLDRLMIALDGTPNKSRLGANAILGVSLAIAKGGGAGREPAALPLRRRRQGADAAGADDEHHQWRRARRQSDRFPGIHDHAGRRADLSRGLADGCRGVPHPQEGAARRRPQHQCRRRGRFRAEPEKPGRSADLHRESRREAGYRLGEDVYFALDPASTEFFKNGKYELEGEGKSLTPDQMVKVYEDLCARYPIVSIEDGMAEDDWEGWAAITKAIGKKVQLVGDDLFVTNATRLAEGIKKGVANAILIKVNQIGSLTETLDAVELAHRSAYRAVMSHRSGETEDNTIADLAVATNCGQIKTGSLARSDRLAKYNQLLRIEEQLGDQATYAGKSVLKA